MLSNELTPQLGAIFAFAQIHPLGQDPYPPHNPSF